MPGIGDTHVHHHSLLAGVGAATAAVLVAGLMLMGVWHRISGAVAGAVTVIVYALAAAFIAAAAYVVWFLFLRARHHLAHPETLTRHPLRAEVVPVIPAALADGEAPAIEAPAPLAALPAPVTHYHFDSPGAVEAALKAMRNDVSQP